MPKTTLAGRVVNALNAFTEQNNVDKTVNSTRGTANDFLRYGNRNKVLEQDWSQVEMSDQDMYTGYSYAAIKKRANRASALGKKFLYTESSKSIQEAAKKQDKDIEHPYLELIRKSKEFSRRKFWHDISVYLDLEGVYYLMAVRAIKVNSKGETQVGAIQKFQMLNPYQVRRVTKQSDGTLGGYIESKDGLYREIPKEMIIEVRLLNPFDNDTPFSMTDAAKESQYTMKQAGDYTRHSIKGNINAPGAISTGVELEDHVFDNFVNRIENHTKGEPLYGNGTGAVNWESMQIDLDKAGLDKINEINRSILFAVTGTSKTALGIEESGTTRDTSQTQKDNFTEDAVMPQVEDILDALNLDYRKWYPEWDDNEYEISLDNPLQSDRESELKDIEIRQSELGLRDTLTAKGYEHEIAAKYAHGEIGLTELGEPTLVPEITEDQADTIAAKKLGQEPAQGDDEPKDGDLIDDITDEDAMAAQTENKFVATNNFVHPKVNEKKIKDAMKKRKAMKVADMPSEAKDGKDAEDQSEEIIDEEEKKKKAPKTEKKSKQTRVVVEMENEVVDKVINQVSIRDDFPDLYEGLIIEPSAVYDDKYRGCIMINTEKIPVTQFVKNAADDLVYSTDRHDHTMGAVAEVEPHATLLYGLLNNGNVWKDKVDTVLDGWKMDTVKIKEVSFFQLEDSKAVVALLDMTPELIDANQRLSLLPHLNTFSEYHAHITLAYINQDADEDKWIKALGKKYNGQVVATKGINYGDELEEDDSEDDDTSSDVKKKTNQLDPNKNKQLLAKHDHSDEVIDNELRIAVKNELDPSIQSNVVLQEANLTNAVKGVEADVVNAVIQSLQEGNYNEATRLISQSQEDQFTAQLTIIFAGFFTILFPIYASQLLSNRLARFGKQGVFQGDAKSVKKYIDDSAKNAAESHIKTILSDIDSAVSESADAVTKANLIKIIEDKVNAREADYIKKLPDNPNKEDVVKAVESGKFDKDPAYKTARDAIADGEGTQVIVKKLQDTYKTMSETRATTIARHESNRVFNMSQYEADLQFLNSSGNMDVAYKRLVSRRPDGAQCPVCQMIIDDTARNPIPFKKNFADLGDELTATYNRPNGKKAVQKIPINYEAIKSGNIHVNCQCFYELLIKNSDGTFINSLDGIVLNDYNPSQARGEDGKWIGGGSISKSVDFKDVDAATDYINSNYDTNVIVQDADVSAVASYTGTGYSDMNEYLRHGTKPHDKKKTLDNINRIKKLQKSIKLKSDTTLYRSPNLKRELKAGDAFTDKGFSSTSLTEQTANNFRVDSSNVKQVLQINAKKGQHGVFPNIFNSTLSENEFILPTNTKYKVESVTKKDNYNLVEVSI